MGPTDRPWERQVAHPGAGRVSGIIYDMFSLHPTEFSFLVFNARSMLPL